VCEHVKKEMNKSISTKYFFCKSVLPWSLAVHREEDLELDNQKTLNEQPSSHPQQESE